MTSGPDEPDALRRLMLDGARLEDGDDVLDLGDGSGLLAADLRARIGDGWVYAITADVGTLEGLLQSAHKLGIAGVAYLVGDPDVLPLPDASVDAAVGGGTFAGAVDAAGTARELCRVLRPGGRLSLVESGSSAGAATALREAGFLDVVVVTAAQPATGTGTEVLITARRP